MGDFNNDGNAAEHARPHEILFRQFPQLFPSDAVRLQVAGVDVQPFLPAGENSFTVRLESHTPAVPHDGPKPAEPEFRIVDAGKELESGNDRP